MEKSDEFDECMLNRQNFSTKILHLENFDIAYFTVIINFTDLGLSRYVETWNLEVLSSDYP